MCQLREEGDILRAAPEDRERLAFEQGPRIIGGVFENIG